MSKTKELNPSEMLMAIDPENFKKAVENSKNPGTALVTVENLARVQHVLATIAELFIIENDITKEKLDQLFNKSFDGELMTGASHTKANLRKQIVQPKVSWDLLEQFLFRCGYDISDVTLTLVSRDTHEVRKISFSDKRKYVEDKFKPSIASRIEI